MRYLLFLLLIYFVWQYARYWFSKSKGKNEAASKSGWQNKADSGYRKKDDSEGEYIDYEEIK